MQIFWKIFFASEIGFESPRIKTFVREIKATWVRGIKTFSPWLITRWAENTYGENKCVDSNGIVARCFVYGSFRMHEHSLRVFNMMLLDGHVEEKWKHTTFFNDTKKPKDLTHPGNWPPSAILNITCKISTRIVYKTCESQYWKTRQSIGFRSSAGVVDCFAVFENVCSKVYGMVGPDVVCNLDLRQAFERIEYNVFFDAFEGKEFDMHM